MKYLDDENGLTESDRLANAIQNGHNIDPAEAVTPESFLAQYGSSNEGAPANEIAPVSAETFLQQYGGQADAAQGAGVTAESFLAQYGGSDAAAPRAGSTEDAETLAAKSQFVMDEAEEGSDTYQNAKAMKAWLDANKEKFDSFSPERKARIAEGINQDYGAAEKQRGHARVFWDAVQRGVGGVPTMMYQGYQTMFGGEDGMQKVREAQREQELDDIQNPKRSASYSNIKSFGDFVDWASEGVGENVPRAVPGIVGAVAGGAVAGPAGVMVGGSLGGLFLNVGEGAQDQLAEEELNRLYGDGRFQVNRGAATAQGIGYSVAEGALGVVPGFGKMLSSAFGRLGGKAAAQGFIKSATETAEKATLKGLGKVLAKNAIEEGVEEVSQSGIVAPVRRLFQTGRALKDGQQFYGNDPVSGMESFLHEELDEFLGGAVIGGLMGGASSAVESADAKRRLDAHSYVARLGGILDGDPEFSKFDNKSKMLVGRRLHNDGVLETNGLVNEGAKARMRSENSEIDAELRRMAESGTDEEKLQAQAVNAYLNILEGRFALEDFNKAVEDAKANGMYSEAFTNGRNVDKDFVEIGNEQGDVAEVYTDNESGVQKWRILDKDGNELGWTTGNRNDRKSPIVDKEHLVLKTEAEADKQARDTDIFNQYRTVKNEAKAKAINNIFENMYGGRGISLELVDRIAPEGAQLRVGKYMNKAGFMPGQMKVVVDIDQVKSVGQLYALLGHERMHADIADYILKAAKVAGANGVFTNAKNGKSYQVIGADGVVDINALNAAQDDMLANTVGAEAMTKLNRDEKGKPLNDWGINQGRTGQELLAESASVEDLRMSLIRGERGVFGSVLEKVQRAIGMKMALDMGISAESLTASDVMDEVREITRRGYLGIKGERTAMADNTTKVPVNKESEKAAGTENAEPEAPAEATEAPRDIVQPTGTETFGPGHVVQRSDGELFTRTEDGAWEDAAGNKVDDAAALNGGYENVVQGKDIPEATVAEQKTDVADAETAVIEPETTVETEQKEEPVTDASENAPKTPVEAFEDEGQENVPAEAETKQDAVLDDPVEVPAEEAAAVAEEPKKEDAKEEAAKQTEQPVQEAEKPEAKATEEANAKVVDEEPKKTEPSKMAVNAVKQNRFVRNEEGRSGEYLTSKQYEAIASAVMESEANISRVSILEDNTKNKSVFFMLDDGSMRMLDADGNVIKSSQLRYKTSEPVRLIDADDDEWNAATLGARFKSLADIPQMPKSLDFLRSKKKSGSKKYAGLTKDALLAKAVHNRDDDAMSALLSDYSSHFLELFDKEGLDEKERDAAYEKIIEEIYNTTSPNGRKNVGMLGLVGNEITADALIQTIAREVVDNIIIKKYKEKKNANEEAVNDFIAGNHEVRNTRYLQELRDTIEITDEDRQNAHTTTGQITLAKMAVNDADIDSRDIARAVILDELVYKRIADPNVASKVFDVLMKSWNNERVLWEGFTDKTKDGKDIASPLSAFIGRMASRIERQEARKKVADVSLDQSISGKNDEKGSELVDYLWTDDGVVDEGQDIAGSLYGDPGLNVDQIARGLYDAESSYKKISGRINRLKESLSSSNAALIDAYLEYVNDGIARTRAFLDNMMTAAREDKGNSRYLSDEIKPISEKLGFKKTIRYLARRLHDYATMNFSDNEIVKYVAEKIGIPEGFAKARLNNLMNDMRITFNTGDKRFSEAQRSYAREALGVERFVRDGVFYYNVDNIIQAMSDAGYDEMAAVVTQTEQHPDESANEIAERIKKMRLRKKSMSKSGRKVVEIIGQDGEYDGRHISGVKEKAFDLFGWLDPRARDITSYRKVVATRDVDAVKTYLESAGWKPDRIANAKEAYEKSEEFSKDRAAKREEKAVKQEQVNIAVNRIRELADQNDGDYSDIFREFPFAYVYDAVARYERGLVEQNKRRLEAERKKRVQEAKDEAERQRVLAEIEKEKAEKPELEKQYTFYELQDMVREFFNGKPESEFASGKIYQTAEKRLVEEMSLRDPTLSAIETDYRNKNNIRNKEEKAAKDDEKSRRNIALENLETSARNAVRSVREEMLRAANEERKALMDKYKNESRVREAEKKKADEIKRVSAIETVKSIRKEVEKSREKDILGGKTGAPKLSKYGYKHDVQKQIDKVAAAVEGIKGAKTDVAIDEAIKGALQKGLSEETMQEHVVALRKVYDEYVGRKEAFDLVEAEEAKAKEDASDDGARFHTDAMVREGVRFKTDGTAFPDGYTLDDFGRKILSPNDMRAISGIAASLDAHRIGLDYKKLVKKDKTLVEEAEFLMKDVKKMYDIVKRAMAGKAMSDREIVAMTFTVANLKSHMMLERDVSTHVAPEFISYVDTYGEALLDKIAEALRIAGNRAGASLRSLQLAMSVMGTYDSKAYMLNKLKSRMAKEGVDGEPNPKLVEKIEDMAKMLEAEHEKVVAAEKIIEQKTQEAAEADAKAEVKYEAELAKKLKDAKSEADKRAKEEYARGAKEGGKTFTRSTATYKALGLKTDGFDFDGAASSLARKFGVRMAGNPKIGLDEEARAAFDEFYAGAGNDINVTRNAIHELFKGQLDAAFDVYADELASRIAKAKAKGGVNAGRKTTVDDEIDAKRKERKAKAAKRVKAEDLKAISDYNEYLSKLANAHADNALRAIDGKASRSDRREALGEALRAFYKMLILEKPDVDFEKVVGNIIAEGQRIIRSEVTKETDTEYAASIEENAKSFGREDAINAVRGTDGYRVQTRQSALADRETLLKAKALANKGQYIEATNLLGFKYMDDAAIVDALIAQAVRDMNRLGGVLASQFGGKQDEDVMRKFEALRKIVRDLKSSELTKDEKIAKYVDLAPEIKRYHRQRSLPEELQIRIDKLTRRLEENDFERKPKQTKPMLDDERGKCAALQVEYRRLQLKCKNAQEQWDLRKSSGMMKIFKGASSVLLDMKGVIGSLDLSSCLRQGGQLSWSHPSLFYKNLGKTMKALKSDEVYKQMMREIYGRDTFKYMEKAGVFFADYGDMAMNGNEEESIMLRHYRQITRFKLAKMGIDCTERAFVAFLNFMRADVFDTLVKSAAFDNLDAVTDSQWRAIGRFINIGSQRGDVEGNGAVEKAIRAAIPAANYVMWSPRNMLSRLQFLKESVLLPLSFVNYNGKALYESYGDATLRKVFAKELLRYLGGVTTMIAFSRLMAELFRGDDEPPTEVVMDPRSSDFMKVKIGNTRLDFLSGLQQILVFSSRALSKKKTNLRGQTHEIYNTYDLIGRFLRSKMAPGTGMMYDLLVSKETFDRQDISWNLRDQLTDDKEKIGGLRYISGSTIVPLTFRDLKEQIVNTGLAETVFTFPLTMLGAGVQAFDPYTYKQMKEDFRYFKSAYSEITDQQERKDFVVRHPMLNRAGSIEAQIKNINRIEKDIKRIEKSGGKPGDWMLDNLEREKKRAINLMAGFKNPFDTGE